MSLANVMQEANVMQGVAGTAYRRTGSTHLTRRWIRPFIVHPAERRFNLRSANQATRRRPPRAHLHPHLAAEPC